MIIIHEKIYFSNLAFQKLVEKFIMYNKKKLASRFACFFFVCSYQNKNCIVKKNDTKKNSKFDKKKPQAYFSKKKSLILCIAQIFT
jgi:hypothetical protein